MGTREGLGCQDAAVRVFERVCNRTEPFSQSNPGLLAGYTVPLLTLVATHGLAAALAQYLAPSAAGLTLAVCTSICESFDLGPHSRCLDAFIHQSSRPLAPLYYEHHS